MNKKRILVLEDQEYMAQLIGREVESQGLEIRLAMTEQEASNLLDKSEPINGAVIDVMAPTMEPESMRTAQDWRDAMNSGIRLVVHIRRELCIPRERLPILLFSVREKDELFNDPTEWDTLGVEYASKDSVGVLREFLRKIAAR